MQAVLQTARQGLQVVRDDKTALEAQLQTRQTALDIQQAKHAAAHQGFVQRTDQVMAALTWSTPQCGPCKVLAACYLHPGMRKCYAGLWPLALHRDAWQFECSCMAAPLMLSYVIYLYQLDDLELPLQAMQMIRDRFKTERDAADTQVRACTRPRLPATPLSSVTQASNSAACQARMPACLQHQPHGYCKRDRMHMLQWQAESTMLQHKAKLEEMEAASRTAGQEVQQLGQQLAAMAADRDQMQAAHQQATEQAAQQLTAASNEADQLRMALQAASEQAAQQKTSQAELQQQLVGRAQEAADLTKALGETRAAADRAQEAAQAEKAASEQGHRAELAGRDQAMLKAQASFGAAVQQLSKVEGDYTALGRKYGKLEALLVEREHELERTAAELDEKSRRLCWLMLMTMCLQLSCMLAA